MPFESVRTIQTRADPSWFCSYNSKTRLKYALHDGIPSSIRPVGQVTA